MTSTFKNAMTLRIMLGISILCVLTAGGLFLLLGKTVWLIIPVLVFIFTLAGIGPTTIISFAQSLVMMLMAIRKIKKEHSTL